MSLCECVCVLGQGVGFLSVCIDAITLPLVPDPQIAFLMLKSPLCFPWLPMKQCAGISSNSSHIAKCFQTQWLAFSIYYLYLFSSKGISRVYPHISVLIIQCVQCPLHRKMIYVIQHIPIILIATENGIFSSGRLHPLLHY